MIAVINTVTPEPCELQQNSPEGQPGGQTLVVHVSSMTNVFQTCPSSFRSLVVEIVLVVSLMASVSSVSSAAESWWRVSVADVHVTWCCK